MGMTEHPPELEEHPRGTLAVVGLFGVIFVIGWLAFFFFVYVPRGAVGR
jgi:hypothetical protein